jgi:DNA-directed RNA polymerase subunit RPC12/RpoP
METDNVVRSLGLSQTRYLNAFDTPPDKCPDCGDDLRILLKDVPRKVFGFSRVKIGYVCLLCSSKFDDLWDDGSPL